MEDIEASNEGSEVVEPTFEPTATSTMGTQHNINVKIGMIIDNLNVVIEKTMTDRLKIFMVHDQIDFVRMIQSHYHYLIFERELFDILCKNKYAIENTTDSDDSISYANSDYPFSLIICSGEAKRPSILVNNVGIVLIKFILYLRMLYRSVGRPDSPNCLLAINTKLLPFGRICIDIDYKPNVEESKEDYDLFVHKCFETVCQFTTTGNIIMSQNCFTPNTRSFHLITEQQFDSTTRQVIFQQIAEIICKLNPNIVIDRVDVWMLPFGRGHVPVRKFDRKLNEFFDLSYPYTEVDFELMMPFDVDQGMDNIYTLYGLEEDDENYDVLHECMGNNIMCSYYISGTKDVRKNLQLFSRVIPSRYELAFSSQFRLHYEANYLSKVMGNKFNNAFIVMSNKKLQLENSWGIPKPKPKHRPSERYEIYRFIEHKFINGIQTMDELFQQMPSDLVKRNVNIGNVDELQNEELAKRKLAAEIKVNSVYTGPMIDLNMDIDTNDDGEHIWDVIEDDEHPWPFVTNSESQIVQTAMSHMRNVHEYYTKTIVDNVYTYEKHEGIMTCFLNIQSMFTDENLLSGMNALAKTVFCSDMQRIQNYLIPLYEFFCRTHYIDACVTADEWSDLETTLGPTLQPMFNQEDMKNYRERYVQMTPGPKAYANFPSPHSPLFRVWPRIRPLYKVILHTIYMMIVEHNYSSIFFFCHTMLRNKDKSQILTSLFLHIIDNSEMEDEEIKHSYASKEFLNFIYMMFLNAGVNYECDLRGENVVFSSVDSKDYITDLSGLFVTSPIWYFLTNFQYVDEYMTYTTRFDIFASIFRQESNPGQASSERSGPPPAKQRRERRGGNNNNNPNIFNTERVLIDNNIGDRYHSDLLRIFFRYILAYMKTDTGIYIYDGIHMMTIPFKEPQNIPYMEIKDPVSFLGMYRHQFGIYNTWTMQMERNTCVLNGQINISSDELAIYPHLFNPYNDDIYRVLVNRYLKSITFTRVLNYQKNLALLLAPIYDPNDDNENFKTLNYNIDSIQINIHDMASPDYNLPMEMFTDILKTKNKLYEMFKWLYCIICHYSERYTCSVTSPSTFIPRQMLLEKGKDDEEDMFNIIQDEDVGDTKEGDNFFRRLHTILESKTKEQREIITDELQKLSRNEITTLMNLFKNAYTLDETETEEPDEPIPDCSTEEIFKFNLSVRRVVDSNNILDDFLESDDIANKSKLKLLLNLFNRKLSSEIRQMSTEEFEHIIEENHSHHITKFVLLCLSWFIRTLHTHFLSETKFFRELQQNRQLLYDDLSNLVFRHNGYFIYNNRITDVAQVFAKYARNVELVVDPVFEMSMSIDKDLYLNYDAEIESRIPPEIIRDIEDACISAIYQGQFIEDTSVDLCRLWARVTVPRNKHRISPLFTLHTATGKSAYITERCSRHFKNKYSNNFLDPSSLKPNDNRGTDMARELNSNLIISIEELSSLSGKFKEVCGYTAVSYKPLFTDSKVAFQNNSTIILSSNNDPKCNEEAIVARLHVFPRRIQYANISKYAKFQRSSLFSSISMLKTNNIMSVQMIMEKLPRVLAENYRGNFMMTWILKRFFLFNIIDHVTIHTSETLQNNINNFHTMIDAQEFVLQRLDMSPTSIMTLNDFRRVVNRICEENRSLFNTKIDTYNVYKILCERLKALVDNEKKIIRVCERDTPVK